MKEFIENLIVNECKKRIEKHGQLSSGTIAAIVVYEHKPEDIKGLYWKVEAILNELKADGKIVKIKDNYYPTADLKKIKYKGESFNLSPARYNQP